MKIHQISLFSLKIQHVIHHGLQRITPREGKKEGNNSASIKAVPEPQEYRRSAYSFPGTLSRKLFLNPRNTDVLLIPFQEHSPGSCS